MMTGFNIYLVVCSKKIFIWLQDNVFVNVVASIQPWQTRLMMHFTNLATQGNKFKLMFLMV